MTKAKAKKEEKKKAPAKKAAVKKVAAKVKPSEEVAEEEPELSEEEQLQHDMNVRAWEKELHDTEHQIMKSVAYNYLQKNLPDLEKKKKLLLKKLGRE